MLSGLMTTSQCCSNLIARGRERLAYLRMSERIECLNTATLLMVAHRTISTRVLMVAFVVPPTCVDMLAIYGRAVRFGQLHSVMEEMDGRNLTGAVGVQAGENRMWHTQTPAA